MPASTRVIFINDFPEQLQPEVLEAFAPHLHLLDREIADLFISPADTDDEVAGVLSIKVRRRYHKANVWVATEFFSYDDEERSAYVLHEFLHALADPLTRFAQRAIFDFVPEGPTRFNMLTTLEEMEERMVDGLALAMTRDNDE